MTESRARVLGRGLLALWIAAVIGTSIQAALQHTNNFEIFRTSWVNLSAGRSLYELNERHHDLFLYSPTFPLLFAPFAVLPFWLGVTLWNALNAGVLYWALGRVLAPAEALAARAIVLFDVVGNMQYAQSNALVAGLMIIVFVELERRAELWAAVAIVIGAAIKIFPAIAGVFAILRPWRLPRFIGWSAVVFLALGAAPLLFLTPGELISQYRSWMTAQHADEGGYSLMHHARMWFGVSWPNIAFQLAGLFVLVAPLSRFQYWGLARYRMLLLASVLMFCVLFNHGAESPSFVIAVTGIAIWFLLSERDTVAWALLALVFVVTVLSTSDLMPAVLRRSVFQPYRLKTLPVFFVWLVTQYQLWSRSAIAPLRVPESGREPQAT